jgi:hypothetical protein
MYCVVISMDFAGRRWHVWNMPVMYEGAEVVELHWAGPLSVRVDGD